MSRLLYSLISKMIFKFTTLLLILLFLQVKSATISAVSPRVTPRTASPPPKPAESRRDQGALRQLQQLTLSDRQQVLLLNRFDAVLYFQLK